MHELVDLWGAMEWCIYSGQYPSRYKHMLDISEQNKNSISEFLLLVQASSLVDGLITGKREPAFNESIVVTPGKFIILELYSIRPEDVVKAAYSAETTFSFHCLTTFRRAVTFIPNVISVVSNYVNNNFPADFSFTDIRPELISEIYNSLLNKHPFPTSSNTVN